MTKRMRELQDLILKHQKAAEEFVSAETPDLEKAAAELDEADKLQKEFDVLERIEKAKKAGVPAEPAPAANVNGFGIMAKLLRGQNLTEEELKAVAVSDGTKALISGTNAANGENYLVPDDVDLTIRELRKTYVQARDYITVETTSTLKGSVNFVNEPTAGLVAFDDGDTLDSQVEPTFSRKNWTISFYGAYIAVSQILEKAEKAQLISYLNRFFVKRAIITENEEIFGALADNYDSGTPKAIEGYLGLKSSINKDIDPSCLIGGVIITNQSGFDCLDSEVDGNGRPILQPDPTNPTVKRFQGLPVVPFSDATLENIDSTHFPIFFGDLKAACTMKVFEKLLFATSTHAAFTKAQTLIRVLEGFAVVPMDDSAYVYGSLTAAE